jgi:hypothetical protein
MANELVLVSSRGDLRDSKHGSSNDQLGIELEAMSTIGRTLDAIDDAALRQRVLNWALARWGSDRSHPVSSEPAARIPPTATTNDPSLAVDFIGELFGDDPADVKPGTTPEIERQAAGAKAPVESMLQSLAADFQRLADEWNGDAKA